MKEEWMFEGMYVDLLCITNNPNSWRIIHKIHGPSGKLGGRNCYYVGKDRKTGKRIYLINAKYADEISKEIPDCEMWVV